MSLTNLEQTTPEPGEMKLAVEALRSGGVVAFPTETVYGLGAAISDERAVNTIFDLKDRPRSRPLLAHVSSVEMARAWSADWPERAEEFAQRFWPGPLTLVVPKGARVPSVVVADGPTVGLRCPDHPVALELIESLGEPIAGTSANRSGQTPAVLPEHVRGAFEPDCVFLLDAGHTPGGLESTVLLLGESSDEDRILRPGPIGASDLGVETDQVEPSPPVSAANSMSRVRVVAQGDLERAIEAVQPVAVMTHHPERIDAACRAKVFAMPSDPAGYSQRMYAALTEAVILAGDKEWIVVVKPDEPGELWRAIVHRLERLNAEA